MIEKEMGCVRLMATIRNGLKLSLGGEQELKRVGEYRNDREIFTSMSFEIGFENKEYRIEITPL